MKYAAVFVLILMSFACSDKQNIPNEKIVPQALIYQLSLPYSELEKMDLKNTAYGILDISYYNEPLDFLLYIFPMLYSDGIHTLDLWFIPENKRRDFENWLYKDFYDREGLIALLKEISFTTLQQRYVDFFEKLWKFQKGLNGEEEPIYLQIEEGIPYFKFLKEDSLLYPEIWFFYGFHEKGNEFNLREYKAENFINQGVTNRVMILSEEEKTYFMILLKSPDKFTLTEMLTEEVKEEDIPSALQEFEDIQIEKPSFYVLRRIRKKMLETRNMRM